MELEQDISSMFNEFNEEVLKLEFNQYMFGKTMKLFNIPAVIAIENNMCWIQNGKHKQLVKPGKIYPEEEFSHLIKAFSIKDKSLFKIIKGKKSCDLFYNPIARNYNANFSAATVIGYDCMNWKECQEYFDIVRDNKDVFSVLYFFREGIQSSNNVAGFVILITIGKVTYYDRIYYYGLEDLLSIEKYCLDRKYKNCYISYVGGVPRSISVKLEKWKYEKYPYFDSLRYLNLNDGTLTNSDRSYRRYKGFVTLNNCHGGYTTK